MSQTTLTGSEPDLYRLSDNDPRRYTKSCAYHSRDIHLKSFNEDRNVPSAFTREGDCQTSTRYMLIHEDGTFFFCWKHVPKEFKENNLREGGK